MVRDGHVMDSMVDQIKLVQLVIVDINIILLLISVKPAVKIQSIDTPME